jgi:hypothetical protein
MNDGKLNLTKKKNFNDPSFTYGTFRIETDDTGYANEKEGVESDRLSLSFPS